jgi:carbonic anhydrase
MPKMKNTFTILILIINLCTLTHSLGDASEWTYEKDGPMGKIICSPKIDLQKTKILTGIDHWPGVCLTGKAQSPINIETTETVSMCTNR